MKNKIFLVPLLFVLLCGCSIGPEGSSVDPSEPTHVHTFSSEYTSDGEYHWHASTCGHDVVKDKAPHVWSEPSYAYDIDHDGWYQRTCGVCLK